MQSCAPRADSQVRAMRTHDMILSVYPVEHECALRELLRNAHVMTSSDVYVCVKFIISYSGTIFF